MEGRLTAPPEIGCSHGSSSSRAYKDDSSGSGTSSSGRSNSSSNSSSASEESTRRCSVSRDDCTSSPDVTDGSQPLSAVCQLSQLAKSLGSLDGGDVNRQLMNILVSSANNEMLITDNTVSTLQSYMQSNGNEKQAVNNRLKTPATNTTSSYAQTDADPAYPSLSLLRNPNSVSPSAVDIASTSDVAEATLPLVIRNFSEMHETMRGPIMGIRGVPWRIMVMPRQHVVQKKGTQKCLGFFLQCCPEAYSDSWSCQASAELRLISQKDNVPNFTRKTNHSYTAKENDWGYSCFMTWADILDPAQGYIDDNTVKVEVSVKAEVPKNILDHKMFRKKVNEYLRLADLQAERGLLDKAIEVNATATKFCKEKDLELRNELENQRARLIDLKLMQSIERIESINKTPEEDTTNNHNAVRQAMGGSLTVRPKVPKKPAEATATITDKKTNRRVQLSIRHTPVKISERTPNNSNPTTPNKTTTNSKAASPTQSLTNPPNFGCNDKTKNDLPSEWHFDHMDLGVDSEVERLQRELHTMPTDENAARDLRNDRLYPFLNDSLFGFQQGSEDEIVSLAAVVDKLKEMAPDFHQAMDQPHMSLHEENSFSEEVFSLTPPRLPIYQNTSCQTDNVTPQVDVASYDSVVVDAAKQKALPESPEEEKTRKVKRVKNRRPKAGSEDSSEHDQGKNPNEAYDDSDQMGLLNANNDAAVTTTATAATATTTTTTTSSSRGGSSQSPEMYFPPPTPPGEKFDGEGSSCSQAVSMQIFDQLFDRLPTADMSEEEIDTDPERMAHDTRVLNECLRKLGNLILHTYIKLHSLGLSDKANDLVALIERLQPHIDYKVDLGDMKIPNRSPSNTLNFPPEPKELEKDFDKMVLSISDYFDRELGALRVVYEKIDIHQLMISINQRIDDDAKDLSRARGRVDQVEKAKTNEVEKLRSANLNDKEQISDLTKQNKELRNTVKRLEKRIKALEPQVAELNAVRHENEQLNKSLQEANKQVADLQNTISRERQSFNDTKSNQQRDYQSLQNDLKSTKGHLDEARNSTRRAEAQLSTERKSHSAAIKAEKERACKAEISQLDVTLDFGIRILERARDDCQLQIKTIENTISRLPTTSEVEREVMTKNIAIWTNTLDEVKNLIESTRNNHQQLVNDLKKGKSLASLDKFVVPPPPPCPKLHHIPTPPQPQPQQPPIAPIGPIRRSPQHHMYSAPSVSAASTFQPLSPKMTPSRTAVTPQPIASYAMPSRVPSYHQGFNRPGSATGSPQAAKPNSNPILPIGVRPPNYTPKTNGVIESPQQNNDIDNIQRAAQWICQLNKSTNNTPSGYHSQPGGIGEMRRPNGGAMDLNSSAGSSTANTDNGFYDLFNNHNDLVNIWPNRSERF